MADVAIIYAKEDRGIVQSLDALLTSLGWTVWWDRYLKGERFRGEIQDQLVGAGCVVVVWSRSSIKKDWVLEEGRFVNDQKRPLIQIKIEQVVIPIGFGQDEVINLVGWKGEHEHENVKRLATRVQGHVGAPRSSWDGKRVLRLSIRKKDLRLPAFFHSVSSHETQLSPDAATQAVELMECGTILISAYDIWQRKYKSKMARSLTALQSRGCIVMLDSGNYEAYRKKDTGWNKTRFRSVLDLDRFDYVFCFDNLEPPLSVRRNVHDVVERVARDQSFAKNAKVLPIVHIPTRKGQFHTAAAPDLFCGIAEAIRPDIIAVPERELGSGIVEKARVVSEIRKRLNQLGRYQAIHLLGTGNPLSLAVLSAAGADTFDGLEWCRTAADHETGLLYHFQQYDFFKQQTRSSASAIAKNAVDRPEVSYSAKVAFHNLEFLRVWMMELQKDTEHERLDRMLRGFLPKGFFRELAEALPEVFPQ